jgi:hypothetical protein
VGGAYTELLQLLHDGSNTEDIFGEYCRIAIERWKGETNYADIAFTDLRKAPPVFEAVRKIAVKLQALYAAASDEEKKLFDEIVIMEGQTQEAPDGPFVYFYDQSISILNTNLSILPFADIYSYVKYLADKTGDAELLALCGSADKPLEGSLWKTVDDAIPYGQESGLLPVWASFGVSLMGKGVWDSGYSNGVYKRLYFDQQTGWSNWLQAQNVQNFVPHPPRSNSQPADAG